MWCVGCRRELRQTGGSGAEGKRERERERSTTHTITGKSDVSVTLGEHEDKCYLPLGYPSSVPAAGNSGHDELERLRGAAVRNYASVTRATVADL